MGGLHITMLVGKKLRSRLPISTPVFLDHVVSEKAHQRLSPQSTATLVGCMLERRAKRLGYMQ